MDCWPVYRQPAGSAQPDCTSEPVHDAVELAVFAVVVADEEDELLAFVLEVRSGGRGEGGFVLDGKAEVGLVVGLLAEDELAAELERADALIAGGGG